MQSRFLKARVLKARTRGFLGKLGNLPVLLYWRRHRFDKRFEASRAAGHYRGVFATYAQAARAAPADSPMGYDMVNAGKMYRDRMDSIYLSDYAVMAWLEKVFAAGVKKVFDLGGHIGLAYYVCQKNIDLPEGLSWQVHDVPAVMAAGREEAQQSDPSGRLTFAEDFSAAADADLLFTSGCIQYLEDTLAQRLGALPRKPKWVLVNLLPLHAQHDYWTVQSIGISFCPYHIQQSNKFFSDMEQLGYRLQDKWENLDKHCWVAFDPAHSLDRYYGAAFLLA